MSSEPFTHSESRITIEKGENGDSLIESSEGESKPSIKANVSEVLQPTFDTGRLQMELDISLLAFSSTSRYEFPFVRWHRRRGTLTGNARDGSQ